jgi:ADP-ribose pyrophosphatase
MKKVYNSPYVKVFLEDFVFKKKKYKNFHKVIFNDAAIVILEHKNKILITKEYRRGIKKVIFGFPGGHIDKNEKPIQTVKRELFEETGCTGKNWKLILTYKNSATYDCGTEYIYIAKLKQINKSKKISDEVQSFDWITIKKLNTLIYGKNYLPAGLIAAVLFYIDFKSK